MEKDLNTYIKQSHINALEMFKEELEKYKETCDPDGWLYEDANTHFTLDNIRLENGILRYDYDGKPNEDWIVCHNEETGEYWEDETVDGIMDTVTFWRKCLHRAEKFWCMDPDHLDAIQNGEAEFNEEEED